MLSNLLRKKEGTKMKIFRKDFIKTAKAKVNHRSVDREESIK
jgi:hypothetical protein